MQFNKFFPSIVELKAVSPRSCYGYLFTFDFQENKAIYLLYMPVYTYVNIYYKMVLFNALYAAVVTHILLYNVASDKMLSRRLSVSYIFELPEVVS